MATYGGVIIYGIEEDKRSVTYRASPIQLQGVRDRVSDVVSSNIREQVDFAVLELPLDDDPSQGFLVLDIPASARDPHMVETKGPFRFYGRVPGGNTILGEAEIAQLYARRQEIALAAGTTLDQAVINAFVQPDESGGGIIASSRPAPNVRRRSKAARSGRRLPYLRRPHGLVPVRGREAPRR